jgi:hypothetical protein
MRRVGPRQLLLYNCESFARLDCRASQSALLVTSSQTNSRSELVNRVTLAVGRLLPVFPWKRTLSRPVGMKAPSAEMGGGRISLMGAGPSRGGKPSTHTPQT